MTKKSRKILLTISLIIILIGEIVFFFVILPMGCTSVFEYVAGVLLDPKYDETDDSLYQYGRDCSTIQFSNKIQIHIQGVREYEEVILCNSKEPNSNDEFFDEGYTILTGDITKYAWNDYKLYIYLDGIFYEFDLNAYEPPALDENGNLRYQPNEYTKEEFENTFLGNKYYWDWHTC